MKRANSQEPTFEISHSYCLDMNDPTTQVSSGNNGRVKSAAILGLALSFGASGALCADSEAAAAVSTLSVDFTSSDAGSQADLPAAAPIASTNAVAYHMVEEGDSLWQIAQEHRVDIQDIKVSNHLAPDTPLQVGQVIRVPNETSSTALAAATSPQETSTELAAAPAAGDRLERLMAGINAASSSTAAVLDEAAPAEDEVLAAEPLTGEAALRSAGLVSQAEGFKFDLDRSAPAVPSEEASAADVSSDAAGEFPAAVGESETSSPQYQVQNGDTLDGIALAAGLSPEQLSAANDIADPDFIRAGDTLVIPDEQPATDVARLGADRLARLQQTATSSVDSRELLEALQSNAADEISSEQASQSTSGDPYLEELLLSVNTAQEQFGEATAKSEQADDAPVETASVPEVAINPEFRPQQSQVSAGGVQERQQAEVLAAAPLDPSAYVASPSPAVGQTVSPGMPILPSADEYLPEAPDYFDGYVWPARGTLTSGYGWRWGRMHRGIDVAGPVGTPIVAAAPGVVEFAGWNSGGYGNLVEVRHADGSMTRYAHNSRILVRRGQRVGQGQHIADMGSTGFSTGPHVHFEVHIPNRGAVNPIAILPRR